MSIQEKVATVDALLGRLEQARQKQTLADALNKRASELQEVELPFLVSVSSLRTLRENGIVSDSRLPPSSKVTERVVAMRQQLRAEPNDVTKGQAFNQLCRAVKSLAEHCDELAATSWSEHVKTKAPVVDKALLDQHRDSPKHANTVGELERILPTLKPLTRRPPPNRETLKSIEQYWERVRQCLRALPMTDDPEVQAFLNAAVSREGAALGLLTPTVIRWLEENGMLADFCIRRSN